MLVKRMSRIKIFKIIKAFSFKYKASYKLDLFMILISQQYLLNEPRRYLAIYSKVSATLQRKIANKKPPGNMELFDLVGVGEQIMTDAICIGALIKEEQLFCLPLSLSLVDICNISPRWHLPPTHPPPLMKVFIHFFEGNIFCASCWRACYIFFLF